MLWLKADVGVYGDANCTTPAGIDAPVGCWQDQSGSSLDALLNPRIGQPVYRADRANGQPALEFSGVQGLSTTATQLFATPNSELSVFVVFDTDNNSGQKFLLNQGQARCATSVELGYDTGTGGGSGNYGLHKGCSQATIAPAGTIANDTYYVMTTLVLGTGDSPANVNIYRNGGGQSVSDAGSGFVNAGSYDTSLAPLDVGIRNDYGSGATMPPTTATLPRSLSTSACSRTRSAQRSSARWAPSTA